MVGSAYAPQDHQPWSPSHRDPVGAGHTCRPAVWWNSRSSAEAADFKYPHWLVEAPERRSGRHCWPSADTVARVQIEASFEPHHGKDPTG